MRQNTCFHVSGEDNIWADFLGRLPVPTIRRLVTIPPLPTASDWEFGWPTDADIRKLQQNQISTLFDNLEVHDYHYRYPGNHIWIPDFATILEMRVFIVGHWGTGGHHAQKTTEKTIRKCFYWRTVLEDVRTFVRSFIHFFKMGGEKVPLPFDPALCCVKPKNLLRFDYIEFEPSTDGEKYVLLLKEDHSRYSWLFRVSRILPSIPPMPLSIGVQHSEFRVINAGWCNPFQEWNHSDYHKKTQGRPSFYPTLFSLKQWFRWTFGKRDDKRILFGFSRVENEERRMMWFAIAGTKRHQQFSFATAW